MKVHIVNHCLSVGSIKLLGVSSSSLLQIGDTECITLYSMFDTPPESVVVGPLVPLSPPDGASTAEGETTGEEG
ncbi:spore gernimation protein GerPD [Paenibacillus sp. GCM10012307]|uniref:Spore gernimation protein GerPD n=1 Tax=Paenibacillus roseus TaxID=2798579 RepID=A0A934JCH5_9BACL|nr:spore gernimation protein GerPD [Paenibacillus roseus]MBJ6364273.1 spore gernimation protein GerPD [Paenibacillus roseus]